MQNLLNFDYYRTHFKYFGYRKDPLSIRKIYYSNALYQGETIFDLQTKRYLRHGLGILINSKCECFYGEFKNDFFEGEGNVILPNGVMVRGSFRKNLLHGVAMICVKQADVFLVEFRHGLVSGPVSLVSPRLSSIVSLYFKDNQFQKEVKNYRFSPYKTETIKNKIIEGVFSYSQSCEVLFDEKDFKNHLVKLTKDANRGGPGPDAQDAPVENLKSGSEKDDSENARDMIEKELNRSEQRVEPDQYFVGSFLIENTCYVYNGVFDSNQTLNGVGIFISFDNKMRIGNFIDDKMNGFGFALINNLLYVANFRDNSLNDRVFVKNMATGEFKICIFVENQISSIESDGQGEFREEFFFFESEEDFRAKIRESNPRDQDCLYYNQRVLCKVFAKEPNPYATNNHFLDNATLGEADRMHSGGFNLKMSKYSFGGLMNFNAPHEDIANSRVSRNLWSNRLSSKMNASHLQHNRGEAERGLTPRLDLPRQVPNGRRGQFVPKSDSVQADQFRRKKRDDPAAAREQLVRHVPIPAVRLEAQERARLGQTGPASAELLADRKEQRPGQRAQEASQHDRQHLARGEPVGQEPTDRRQVRAARPITPRNSFKNLISPAPISIQQNESQRNSLFSESKEPSKVPSFKLDLNMEQPETSSKDRHVNLFSGRANLRKLQRREARGPRAQKGEPGELAQ